MHPLFKILVEKVKADNKHWSNSSSVQALLDFWSRFPPQPIGNNGVVTRLPQIDNDGKEVPVISQYKCFEQGKPFQGYCGHSTAPVTPIPAVSHEEKGDIMPDATRYKVADEEPLHCNPNNTSMSFSSKQHKIVLHKDCGAHSDLEYHSDSEDERPRNKYEVTDDKLEYVKKQGSDNFVICTSDSEDYATEEDDEQRHNRYKSLNVTPISSPVPRKIDDEEGEEDMQYQETDEEEGNVEEDDEVKEGGPCHETNAEQASRKRTRSDADLEYSPAPSKKQRLTMDEMYGYLSPLLIPTSVEAERERLSRKLAMYLRCRQVSENIIQSLRDCSIIEVFHHVYRFEGIPSGTRVKLSAIDEKEIEHWYQVLTILVKHLMFDQFNLFAKFSRQPYVLELLLAKHIDAYLDTELDNLSKDIQQDTNRSTI